jgi:hypothetical protein
MRDEIGEQLSALVDDELDEIERPLLLGRLQRDTGLREILGRYQLISEVMRGAGQVATLGIADRVKRALEQDSTLPETDKPNTAGLSWLKPIAVEPRIDKRLAAYLVNHNEYAASRGVQGVMPYVRIVGYEHNRQ